jgi:hypothetical protein
VLGREIPLPDALAELLDRPLLAEPLENNPESLKRRLRAFPGGGKASALPQGH